MASAPDTHEPALFIDEHRRVFSGRDARERLQQKNDSALVDPVRGIVRVDPARWEEAQRYERLTWLRDARYCTSDRNEDHRIHFAGFGMLRGMHFDRAIELGCGPFTNLRLILPVCRVGSVTLLDPLIDDYPRHIFCSYAGGRLEGLLRPRLALRDLRHPRTFLSRRLDAFRAGRWFGRPVERIGAPIEEMPERAPFDLVVMINVLEHCRDAEAVFAKLDACLAPGGIFVFADALYQADETARLCPDRYDAGHPLHVDRSVTTAFLESRFTPLMWAEYLRASVFSGVAIEQTDIYFIGRRNPSASVC